MNRKFSIVLGEIEAALRKHTGRNSVARPLGEPGGGQINQTLKLEFADSCYFVKLNSASRRKMFEAEMAGLDEIISSGSVRVPVPICAGDDGNTAFLIMENLELRNSGDTVELGAKLAAMHLGTQEYFGWQYDNTIGTTQQLNTRSNDWIKFFRACRLGFQLELAARNGYAGQLQREGEQLVADMDGFFTSYRPQPALLHGDLWSGNHGYLPDGEPVIYDPAVYYGDREADVAMTELFGGFGPDFYAAYHANYPLDVGYPVRKHLYNLYHVLNHLNLFGSGYLRQAESMIRKLRNELR